MLARSGAQEAQEILFVSPFYPLSRHGLRQLLRGGILGLWQERWGITHDCYISRCFIPTVSDNKGAIRLSVKQLQRLSQIITGHGLFKRHLRHWNDIEDYRCSLCQEEEEDSYHLWSACPALERERMSRQGSTKELESQLLAFFQLPKVRELEASNEALLVP